MPKILITGASGFVGSFLVEHALNRGYEVYAGIRKSSSKKYLKDPRIKFIYLDFFNKNELKKSISSVPFDYIIQNAGVTKAKDSSEFYKVNAEALDNLLMAIQDSDFPLTKFIFVSSLAAYGPAELKPEGIVNNDVSPTPVTTYGKSKLEGEQILKGYENIPHIIIRPTAVYGPREMDLLTVYKMLNNRLELLIGFEKQKLTFIYVKDLVNAIFDLLPTTHKNKAYFITDGNIYSAEELNTVVKNQLKKSTIKLKLPISLIRFIAIISEKVSSLSGNYPALNLEKVNELECKSWECDISNLIADIGFKPQYDLKKGMSETLTWYKENNFL